PSRIWEGGVQVLCLSIAAVDRPVASRAISRPGPDRQLLESAARDRCAVSRRTGCLLAAVPRRWPNEANAVDAALHRGRLQLPASRPVWRACFSAAGDHVVVQAWRGFHRRGICDDRSVGEKPARRGGAVETRRCGGVYRESTARNWQ